MTLLKNCEPPLVAYYCDKKPATYIGPKGGFFIDIKKTSDILILFKKAKNLKEERKEKFRCIFQFLAQTRKKHIPSVFDYENFGCPGCRFYLGFIKEIPMFNHYFISTGFPLLYIGERIAPTSESSKKHADLLKGIKQKGKYVIFDSIENISFDVDPELVIFFCNADILSGLVGLIRFVTDEPDAVLSPFSSGCGSIFSWPIKYYQDGLEKAVLGVFDPAARPYMNKGDMTLSIPYSLFKKILSDYKRSFIYRDKIKSYLIREPIPGWPDLIKRM